MDRPMPQLTPVHLERGAEPITRSASSTTSNISLAIPVSPCGVSKAYTAVRAEKKKTPTDRGVFGRV